MKKRIIFLVWITFSILSCKSQDNLYLSEIISERPVFITCKQNTDGLQIIKLNVPIEFKVKLNENKIESIKPYCIIDNKQLIENDYCLINGETNKKMLKIGGIKGNEFPNSIYILDQRIQLEKEDAERFLKNKSNKTLKNFLQGDTIKLSTYRKFIEDNPSFIKEMRKEPDSLILSIHFFDGESKIVREKIKWLDK